MEALLDAVEARIRAALGYTSGQCAVQPDGAPEAWSGQIYLAVHPGEVRDNGSQGLRLDELYSVSVTITMKSAFMPKDRLGDKLVKRQYTGIYARAHAIRALIHMNQTVRTDANTLIGADENGFLTPLEFLSIGMLTARGPEWLSSDMKAPPHAVAAWSLEVRFGNANRVQKIEEMS
jgi:hypothetical protein